MRPAVAPLVLGDLVGQGLGRLALVPGGDALAQRPAPAAEALHGLGEGEQVRARAADLRQRLGGGGRVAHPRGDRQRQDGRLVLRCPARVADLRRSCGSPAPASASRQRDDRLRVLDRQRPLGRVVRARPRSRGSGTARAASSRRPRTRTRRPSSGPSAEPGIGSDCGVWRVLKCLRNFVPIANLPSAGKYRMRDEGYGRSVAGTGHTRFRETLGPSGSPSAIGPPRARVRSRTCLPDNRCAAARPSRAGQVGANRHSAPAATHDRAGTATGHLGNHRDRRTRGCIRGCTVFQTITLLLRLAERRGWDSNPQPRR